MIKYVMTEEHKDNLKKNHWSKKKGYIHHFKGKRHSEETKEKIRNHFKGKPLSESHKRNISKYWRNNQEKHNFWKGGISFEEYGAEFDSSLKEQIRFRDKYKCQICGCTQLENGKQLDVHHVDYNKKNNNSNNLVALCHKCHMKTNYKRKYWKQALYRE